MQSAKLSPLHQNDLFWSHSAVSTSEGHEASTTVRTTSDLPTWVHLPDMGITSKTGPESDEEAEDDELASDHDGDQVLPAKRRKTLSASTNRRGKRKQSPNPSLLPLEASPSHIAPGSNDGTSQLALALNASFTAAGPSNISAIQTPPPEVVASRQLAPGKVKPSTQTQLPGSWMNAIAATNRSSQFNVPPDRESSLQSSAPSNSPALSSLSQKRKILVPDTKRRSRRRNEITTASEIPSTRALPFAEPISASTSSSREHLVVQTSRSYLARHAKATAIAPAKSSGYQANQDEIEDWTEATVASLVFRKPPYSRRAEAEVRMMNAAHLRRMIDARQMVPPTGNEATIANRPVKPVAIPATSLSAQTEALIESIFGPEDSTVRSQVIKPTAKNKRRLYSKSRASSTSDAHTAHTSELPTPPAEFAPDPIQNHVIVIDSPSPPLQSSALPTIHSDSKPQGPQSPVIGLTEDSDTERKDLTITTDPSAEGARTTNSLPHLNWTLDVYTEPLYPPTISPTSSRHPSPFPGAISHTSTNPATPLQFLPIPESSASVIRSRSREAQRGSPDSRPAEVVAALVGSSVSGTEEDTRTFQSFPPTDDFHVLEPRNPENVVIPSASQAQRPREAEQLQGGMDQEAVLDPDNMYVDEPEIPTIFQTERQPSHATSAPLLSESQHASPSDSDHLPREIQPTPATFSPHPAVENISPIFTPQHSPPANIRPASYLTWELTDHPSQPIPLPTVFDPGYLKSRTQAQDAYHIGAELEAEAVIGEINPIEDGGALDGMDTDEDEVDELADDNEDSMVVEPLGGSISNARKVEGIQNSVSVGRGNYDTSTDEGVGDVNQLIDSPEALAAEVEQWKSVLQSLLKGKKKFGEEDMQHLKDTLQSIYAHRTLIGPTSALAETVYAIANLRAEDIPDKDQIGLRALARKSVRAWGIRKQGTA